MIQSFRHDSHGCRDYSPDIRMILGPLFLNKTSMAIVGRTLTWQDSERLLIDLNSP